jgi:hypothetical protein
MKNYFCIKKMSTLGIFKSNIFLITVFKLTSHVIAVMPLNNFFLEIVYSGVKVKLAISIVK